jgi:hypothetical protein
LSDSRSAFIAVSDAVIGWLAGLPFGSSGPIAAALLLGSRYGTDTTYRIRPAEQIAFALPSNVVLEDSLLLPKSAAFSNQSPSFECDGDFDATERRLLP